VLKLKYEIKLNVRYGFAGILNSLIGVGTIWALTKLGTMPVVANFAGFAGGLVFAFLFSRKFVFRSKGHMSFEAVRYLNAFVISYLINIAILQMCVSQFFLGALLSQGFAVSAYVISMYLASRFYIFRRSNA
jgi:putative flippase GtrA